MYANEKWPEKFIKVGEPIGKENVGDNLKSFSA